MKETLVRTHTQRLYHLARVLCLQVARGEPCQEAAAALYALLPKADDSLDWARQDAAALGFAHRADLTPYAVRYLGPGWRVLGAPQGQAGALYLHDTRELYIRFAGTTEAQAMGYIRLLATRFPDILPKTRAAYGLPREDYTAPYLDPAEVAALGDALAQTPEPPPPVPEQPSHKPLERVWATWGPYLVRGAWKHVQGWNEGVHNAPVLGLRVLTKKHQARRIIGDATPLAVLAEKPELENVTMTVVSETEAREHDFLKGVEL